MTAVSAPRRITHARLGPQRGGVRNWWAKAWQRAVEEAAYGERDLRRGRAAARRGDVGAISVAPGSLLAAVREGDDAWTVEVAVPVLDDPSLRALVDVVSAEAGRIAALLDGDLSHQLVEHADEAGAELLPYGGELSATCTCDHYLDPCAHAIAVLLQAGWLVDRDPLVLFAVRGLPRDELVGAVHDRRPGPSGGAQELADDVELAADAVLRARQLLAALEAGDEVPDGLL